MKKRLLLVSLIAGCLMSSLAGCSFEQREEEQNLKQVDDLSLLESGYYYVKHTEGKTTTYTKVAEGFGTFNREQVVDAASDDRALEFREDWEDIPTLYEGDELIFYSEDDLTETFNFERFEDFGYSIPVAEMQRTPSKRYKAETNPETPTVYPNSELSEISTLPTETVVFDTIGGIGIRDTNVSRVGTVVGLTPFEKYEVEAYSGSNLYKYVCEANVRMLGSMEVVITNEFVFESETILNIAIPEFFNSGYYCINGIGVFRYLKGATQFDESYNFNVPNEIPNPDEEFEEINNPAMGDVNENYEKADDNTENEELSIEESGSPDSFDYEISAAGTYGIVITAINDKFPEDVSATITAPDGKRVFNFVIKEERLYASVKARVPGKYHIDIKNLNGIEYEVGIQ